MTTYRICTNCSRPMRTSNQRLADHPGTVVHRGHGYCKTCLKHAPITERAIDPAAVARTASELAGYLAWRRPYREGASA